MPFVPFPDTVSLNHRFDWNGRTVSFGIHLQKTGYTPAQAQQLANIAGSAWASELAARQVVAILADVVTVQDLSAPGAPNYENPDEIGVSGDIVADGVPNNAALIISHRTADTGRSARGRTYFPGASEGDCVLGVPTPATLVALAAAWAAYIVLLQGPGWQLVVAQRVANGVPLALGVARPVTDEIFPVRMATQRLRQAP